MIAEGHVFPDRVEYNALPWKYAAGTPNIIGTVVSAEALRLLIDLALSPNQPEYFRTDRPIQACAVREAMTRVSAWNHQLTSRALDGLDAIAGVTVYGPRDPARRTSLVSFNLVDQSPSDVAEALNRAGVESRAGCHCASLAHQVLKLTPSGSCRLSFYLYNTLDDVDRAVNVVAEIATRRTTGSQRPPVLARATTAGHDINGG
jgi:cysteine desulfurase/selenocysteine lyase